MSDFLRNCLLKRCGIRLIVFFKIAVNVCDKFCIFLKIVFGMLRTKEQIGYAKRTQCVHAAKRKAIRRLHASSNRNFNDQIGTVLQCFACPGPFVKTRWFSALKKVSAHCDN